MAGGAAPLEGLSACECPVCFQILSETRLPLSMPCGHTLCRPCIDALVEGARPSSKRATPTFKCPICREWINRESVSLNVTLRDLIAELARLKLSSPSSSRTALHVAYEELQMGPALDRGAFGVVCRAQWKGDDVAVKLFSSGEMTPSSMEAFRREVFVMNCLRHPNVVLLMGACQTPPRLAIIMEFVSGGSLHKVLHVDQVVMTDEVVCSVGRDICRGLQYLHSINVLHRDLKSKNVLLTAPPPACQAKLCDFGLARMRLESATMTGNIGTVHWSAPEVLNSARYQFPADVYSFGMVLYEMATGAVPFGAMLPVAVMMAVAIKREKPPLVKPVHPLLGQLIHSCIEWEAGARPSVAQVIFELTRLLPSPAEPDHASSTDPHSHSLGVVFVSVTDSEDFTDQDLTSLAQDMGIVGKQEQNTAKPKKETDYFYADFPPQQQQQQQQQQQWQQQQQPRLAPPEQRGDPFLAHLEAGGPEGGDEALARRVQLEYDAQLAAQLQMRENAYLKPSEDVPVTVTPPPKVLQSIKSRKGKPLLTPALKQELMKAKLEKYQQEGGFKPATASPPPQPSTAPPPPPPPPFTFTAPPPPPPSTSSAPPPPPPPPFLRKAPPQHGRKGKPLRPDPTTHSYKRKLLTQVRTLGPSVYRRLRPVDTVEKRAFRVGRVVDGYDSTRAQFTFQNLLHSFNHRWLNHVQLVEPPSHVPLGRVVLPPRSMKVKRISSLYDSSSAEDSSAPKPLPLGHSLHPAIRSAIEQHPFSEQLHHVEPVVKDTLPTLEVIEQERAILEKGSSPSTPEQAQQAATAEQEDRDGEEEENEEGGGAELEWDAAATRIQAAWRAWATRKAYLNYLETYKKLQNMRKGGKIKGINTKVSSRPVPPVGKSKSHPPALRQEKKRKGKKMADSKTDPPPPYSNTFSSVEEEFPVSEIDWFDSLFLPQDEMQLSSDESFFPELPTNSLPPLRPAKNSNAEPPSPPRTKKSSSKRDLPPPYSNEFSSVEEVFPVSETKLASGFDSLQLALRPAKNSNAEPPSLPRAKKSSSKFDWTREPTSPSRMKFSGKFGGTKKSSADPPPPWKFSKSTADVCPPLQEKSTKFRGAKKTTAEPSYPPRKKIISGPSKDMEELAPSSSFDDFPSQDMKFSDSGVKTVELGGAGKRKGAIDAPPQYEEEQPATKGWFGGRSKTGSSMFTKLSPHQPSPQPTTTTASKKKSSSIFKGKK